MLLYHQNEEYLPRILFMESPKTLKSLTSAKTQELRTFVKVVVKVVKKTENPPAKQCHNVHHILEYFVKLTLERSPPTARCHPIFILGWRALIL